MWKTALLLIVTLLVVPVATYYFDDPLTAFQQDILRDLVTIYLIAAGLCFLISTITDNYSQVDKLWSTIPIVYVWVTAYASSWEPRIVLMAVLVSIWGLRLTFNFARRGGYSWRFWEGEEDYRWDELRAKPGFEQKWKWVLFNLFFISLYQMGLILLFTLPILKSVESGALGAADIVLSLLFVALVAYETIADQQQWNFQKVKYSLLDQGKELPEPYKSGFVQSGLWGLSRHPNYFAEQSIWVVFYLFSVVATGNWINWSIAGVILLILLFKGSSDFSEEISARKYPAYKQYQARVSRFIPWPKSKKMDAESSAPISG